MLHYTISLSVVKELNTKKTREIEQLRNHTIIVISLLITTSICGIRTTLRARTVMWNSGQLLHVVSILALALSTVFRTVPWNGEDAKLKNQLVPLYPGIQALKQII